MGEPLADGNIALALLANSAATGGALFALIMTFGPISGAHFNPAVTWLGGMSWREAARYICVQIVGAFVGVMVAHLMFSEPLLAASTKARAGSAQVFSEFVATFGLVAVIWGLRHAQRGTRLTSQIRSATSLMPTF